VSSANSTVIVFWDNPEKTIEVYDFAAIWTWKDFYAAKEKGDAMINSVSHEVVVVFSGPVGIRLPESFLTNVININRARHPRARLAIVVVNNAFVRVMFNTFSRLYSREVQKVAFVNSLEEARRVATSTTGTS
jgi:hypothetical protein